jgi:hypothetical protein
MADNVKQKQHKVANSLKMPVCLRKTRDATSQALFKDTPESPKVETIKLQVIENETWLKMKYHLLACIEHIGDIKDMLLQTMDTLPGLYQDFSIMHEFLANDINMLQTRVDLIVSKSQKASRQETLVSTMDVPLVDSNFQPAIYWQSLGESPGLQTMQLKHRQQCQF